MLDIIVAIMFLSPIMLPIFFYMMRKNKKKGESVTVLKVFTMIFGIGFILLVWFILETIGGIYMNAVLIVLGVILLIMLITPKGRTLLKGFIGVFIEDMSKTPEGVRAIYQEKINDLSKNYNMAHDNYKKLIGRQTTLEKSIEDDKETKQKYDKKICYFIEMGKEDDAKLFATKASQLDVTIKNKEKELEELEPIVKDAEFVYNTLARKLEELKLEQEEQVRRFETAKQMESIYDSMEKVATNTGVDNLLDTARKTVKDSEARAQGAKEVHEQNIDTKIDRLTEQYDTVSADDYISNLLNKDREDE